METNQSNIVKVGDITKKTLEETKKRTEALVEISEEFNLVTYIDCKRVDVGEGWLNSGTGRPPKFEIRADIAQYLAKGKPLEAWIFPKKRKKELKT